MATEAGVRIECSQRGPLDPTPARKNQSKLNQYGKDDLTERRSLYVVESTFGVSFVKPIEYNRGMKQILEPPAPTKNIETRAASHAESLGDFIRATRQARGVGIRELSERSGIPKGTLSKLENGLVEQPRSGLLDRLARGLGISISELHAAAGYDTSLPAMPVYLRSQYRHLSPEQQEALTKQVEAITQKYGQPFVATGPAPGEDESV